jgi:hypothetical protein
MVEHAWTVFCSRAITDSDTNQVSLIDTIEGITVGAPPDFQERLSRGQGIAVPFSCVLVTLWTRSDRSVPEQSKCQATLLDPLGKTGLEPTIFEIDLTEKERMRTHLKMAVLPVHVEGRYTFQMDIEKDNGWRTVARVPFELKIQVTSERERREKAPRRPPKRPAPRRHRP